MRTTGKIEIRATALEPILHGAGTSGNTQLLRMQPVVLDDGSVGRVPFISGNSVKHKLRASAVSYALDALGVEDGSLSKAEVDLLFSGGHLSKSGAAIDLGAARQLEQLFPALSLCGYSAGNAMTESKLRVSHLHLICKENSWRLPDDLRDSPHLQLRAGALRVEDFGTRHDMASKAVGVRLLSGEATAKVEGKKKKALAESTPSDRGDSAQMIYDYQCIAAGAKLWGTVWFGDITDLEMAALASAFHYSAGGQRDGELTTHIGAKNSVGYGAIAVELRSALRVTTPQYEPTEALAVSGVGGDRGAKYVAHLRERKSEILAAIREAVA